MGKLGAYKNVQEQISNPINIYLDNIKGQLGVWDKELGKNIFHELNNFIILSVGFTIKGKVWDDNIKKYTNTYYSNEIRQFNETIYAIDMVFNNGQAIKTLVAKGNWKTDVKPLMPQSVGIKAMITVLDLDDGLVKCFSVAASQYFGENGIQATLKNLDSTDILKYEIVKMYTNGSKDKNGNDIMITEKELDKMKGSEAAQYKNRYLSKITKVSDGTKEGIEAAEGLVDAIDEYYNNKKEYYSKTYGVVNNTPEGNYAKLTTDGQIQSDEEFKKEVEAERLTVEAIGKTQEHNSSEKIHIEDIPF